jgi:hypothetical protein
VSWRAKVLRSKKWEGGQHGRRECLSVFILRDATRKLLELMKTTFSKVAGHQVNTQKSSVFLHNNKEHTEKEIRKAIPFTIA